MYFWYCFMQCFSGYCVAHTEFPGYFPSNIRGRQGCPPMATAKQVSCHTGKAVAPPPQRVVAWFKSDRRNSWLFVMDDWRGNKLNPTEL
jgi:hypothetical protein